MAGSLSVFWETPRRSWVARVGAPRLVGFPGLWAVVLWSFEGLPFVAGGDALSWW